MKALQCAALCRRLDVVELMVDMEVEVGHGDDIELELVRQADVYF